MDFPCRRSPCLTVDELEGQDQQLPEKQEGDDNNGGRIQTGFQEFFKQGLF